MRFRIRHCNPKRKELVNNNFRTTVVFVGIRVLSIFMAQVAAALGVNFVAVTQNAAVLLV